MMWWLPGEGMVASGFDELYNDLRVLLVLLKRRVHGRRKLPPMAAKRGETEEGGGGLPAANNERWWVDKRSGEGPFYRPDFGGKWGDGDSCTQVWQEATSCAREMLQ
jgi:hypothetical protein